MSENKSDIVVWWTSEEDCKAIGYPIETRKEVGDEVNTETDIPESELNWPRYILGEYLSRYGRSGRGRIWTPVKLIYDGIIDSTFHLDFDLFEKKHPLINRINHCGGIVILQDDAVALAPWPGFITDTQLNIWKPKQIEISK